MGRKKRIWLPTHYYHVVCRGNRRDPLFKDDSDFVKFLYILQKVYEKYPYEIASYCLMDNHFHLQIRSPNEPISKIMFLINKRYANFYNNKYHMTGHVFEKRYYDKLIDSDIGMREVSKYIHLNPVKARMVRHPAYYKWSSYNHYAGDGYYTPQYMQIDVLLDNFSGPKEIKRQTYCKYCLE